MQPNSSLNPHDRFPLRTLSFAVLAWLTACGTGAHADAISNDVKMEVTERGFEPKDIHVRMGKPVTLSITRKTNDTCANEIVIDEPAVHVKLPLGEVVRVSFTPTKSGTLRFGCAMQKMIGGVIRVEP